MLLCSSSYHGGSPPRCCCCSLLAPGFVYEFPIKLSFRDHLSFPWSSEFRRCSFVCFVRFVLFKEYICLKFVCLGFTSFQSSWVFVTTWVFGGHLSLEGLVLFVLVLFKQYILFKVCFVYDFPIKCGNIGNGAGSTMAYISRLQTTCSRQYEFVNVFT